MSDKEDEGGRDEEPPMLADELPASVLAHSSETLKPDEALVSEFWRGKYEKEARKNWDLFYKRNTTKFYKDRHYLQREFEELRTDDAEDAPERVLVEVGCGVGNAAFPLIRDNPNLFVFALDFSPRAIDFVKAHELYASSGRCSGHVCDVVLDEMPHEIVGRGGADMISLIFVLSAISPENHALVVAKLFNILKPGGVLLFRDYGRYDLAQLRFKPGHKLAENFYVRQDGTRAFYFALEDLDRVFSGAGFEVELNKYCLREITNRKRGITMERVWVQSKFRKPLDAPAPA